MRRVIQKMRNNPCTDVGPHRCRKKLVEAWRCRAPLDQAAQGYLGVEAIEDSSVLKSSSQKFFLDKVGSDLFEMAAQKSKNHIHPSTAPKA